MQPQFRPSAPIRTTSEPDSPVATGQPPQTEPLPEGVPAAPGATCIYAGLAYAVGSRVCMGGLVHQCYGDGQWYPTTDRC
jgi:hypothetical protein